MDASRTYRSPAAYRSSDNRYSRRNNLVNPTLQGSLFQFFIKPHLAVIGLHKQKFTIRYRREGQEGETEGYLWSLRIKNRYGFISKSVKDCVAYVYYSNIGEEIPLNWNTGTLQYLDQVWELVHESAHYARYLTVDTIFRQTRRDGDIPAGETRNVHFLFTAKDSNNASMIVHLEEYRMMEADGEMYHSFANTPLKLLLGESHQCYIRFEGDDRGKKYTIQLNSYDDVRLF